MLWTVVRFLVFEIWSILYANIEMNRGTWMNSEEKNYINPAPRAQAPDAFGSNPPSQLVIGHHWLTFLIQVHKASLVPINQEFLVKNRPYFKN